MLTRGLLSLSLLSLTLSLAVGCTGGDDADPGRGPGIGPGPGGAAPHEIGVVRTEHPEVRFVAPMHDFGKVQLGVGATATLVLENTGDAPAELGAAAVTGAGFALQSSACPAELSPGAACDLVVSFTPAARGAHGGALEIAVDGQPRAAPLAGLGAWVLEVAPIGAGGLVTSTPAGIACGATCSAMFVEDAVVLAAVPPAGSAVAWAWAGCTGETCVVPAPDESGYASVTVTFSPAMTELAIDVVAGTGATGAVQVRTATGGHLATCNDDCAVAVAPGEMYQIIAAAPSKSQISGACSAASSCWFTAATGPQSATVTFDLDGAANEEWTVLLPSPIRTAAFDGSGNLVAGGASLYKLSPAGALVWTLPLAAVAVATGPADTIYVHLGAEVQKLDAAGGLLWSQPIPSGATGCSPREFMHCLAVGPDGAVAVRGTARIARWTTDGPPSWTRPVPDDQNFAIVIDGLGVVGATIEGPSLEARDLVRFAPTGEPLPLQESICAQYHAMLWLDGGVPACASSGYSSVYGIGSIDLADPDYVPTGAAGTGIGHVGWVFYDNDNFLPWQLDWRMRRHDAAHQLVWQKRGGVTDLGYESIGTTPLDVAGSATGRLALVGAYDGFDPAPLAGFVTSFAP